MENLAKRILRENPELHDKLISHCAIDEQDSITAFAELLKFFHISADSDQRCTPSVIVDNMWHEFILFTREYAAFCDAQFGQFIHHSPGGTTAANHAQYLHTLRSLQLHFSVINHTYWPVPTTLCLNIQCGSCDT